jgi:hypothetical protein
VKQSLQNYALLRQATPDDLVRLAKRLNLPVTSNTPQ